MITKEPELEVCHTVFWTDSTTVLRYIENRSRRFSVFVADRLSSVHASPQVSQYMAVRRVWEKPFKGNNARRRMQHLVHGTDFLWQPDDCWPAQPAHLSPVADDAPEVKQVKFVNVITRRVNPSVSVLIHHYSTWTKLVKATAWMTRFKQYIVRTFSDKYKDRTHSTSCFLTVEEADAAALGLVRLAQQEAFTDVGSILRTVAASRTLLGRARV